MNSKLFQGSVGASSSKNFSVTNKHVNGLLIAIDNTSTGLFGADCYLSITLRDRREAEVLANRIPLRVFADISNIVGGLSVHAQQQARGDAGTVAQHEFMAIAIDLGSLHIGDGRLEIEYENGGQAYTMYFGTYSMERTPDRMLKYQITNTLTEVFGQSRAIYYYDATNELTAPSIDASFEIEAGDQKELDTVFGLAASTAALYEIEATPSIDLVSVYQASDLPQEVYLNITGSNATGSIVHVAEIHKDYRVAASTINNAHRAADQLEKIEKKAPHIARAYRYAGIAVKSDDYRKAAKAASLPPA